MKKPEVIELIRKHVNSGSRLYPLLDYTSKELLEYIDKRDEIFNKAIKFLKDNASFDEDCKYFCDDLRYDDCEILLEILRGEK